MEVKMSEPKKTYQNLIPTNNNSINLIEENGQKLKIAAIQNVLKGRAIQINQNRLMTQNFVLLINKKTGRILEIRPKLIFLGRKKPELSQVNLNLVSQFNQDLSQISQKYLQISIKSQLLFLSESAKKIINETIAAWNKVNV